MNLTKAFDTLNKKLLIAKFETYGLNSGSSSFVLQSYLTTGYERTKKGLDILRGKHQRILK